MEAEQSKETQSPQERQPGPPTPPKSQPPSRAVRKQPSGWRKWLYRLIAMTVVPVLLLGAVELALRLFGFGYPTGFFLKATIEGRAVYVENPEFGRRFFPPGQERAPVPFVVPADKQAGTYRIFVLGESAAQGFPDTSYSFSRILEVLLRHQYPGTRFEVINTAMTAINSNVLLPIARDCGDHQPDLFIVYAGNNEVVGPYGAADVLGPYCSSRGAIRATLFVKSLKTSQLLSALGRAVSRKQDVPSKWGGMGMFLNSQVQATDPRLEGVHDHFRANLEDICRTGRDAGAQVVVCTVATNLKDCPPFASLHEAPMTPEQAAEWERMFAEGVRAESAGNHGEATLLYEQAAALDPGYAELQFRRGRCLATLARDGEARVCYQGARDLDTLRFRADSQINEAVRAVAGERAAEGVHLVDVEQIFAQASSDGVPGENLFYEHVHMNFSGNYLLARSIFERLAAILPEKIRSQAVEGRAPLSEQACAERLGLTAWNRLQIAMMILKLVQQPPFGNQPGQGERQARWRKEVQDLQRQVDSAGHEPMLATYRRALELADEDPILRGNFALMLQEFGDTNGALTQWELVVRRSPRDLRARLNLAELLGQKGKFAEAAAHCSEVMQIAPRNPFARLTLGKLRAREGKLSAAVTAYSEALRLDPLLVEAHVARADALAEQGKIDDAIADYTEALRRNANYKPAHQGLALLYFKRGSLDEAAHHFGEVLRVEPDNVAARVNLGVVLAQQRKFDEAIAAYSEALRIQPGNEQIQVNLGLALADAGRLDEAVSQLQKVLVGNPRSIKARYRLATIYSEQGKRDEAVAQFEEVLRQQPDWTEAAEKLAALKEHTGNGRQ
jgi:tetratricopeptide (TPR) repeat protein